MKTYGIKTAQGYLATQGRERWFQKDLTGWAAYTTKEHARDVAEAHHSAIGTATEDGYTIEETGAERNTMLKAAIIVEGQTFTGRDHVEAMLNAPYGLDMDSRTVGFVNELGDFFDRQDAFEYAKANGLLSNPETTGRSLQSWMLK